ncbi:replication endonuclease [Hafnia alvei]|uniref:replication endonuclease n=1 Tax=Hafnia alvei TaxID=569 RepID=UPI00103315DD|nr:replication endonuclease [Hafnia alvei]TBL90123.1 replication endonuclease [Hafnia alvei]
MSQPHRGRIAPSPPPPYTGTQADAFVGTYPWNAPKKAIGRERQLTLAEYQQGQAVLRRIDSLPRFLSAILLNRHAWLLKNKSLHAANKFLVFTVEPRIWPRLDIVNRKFAMNLSASQRFMSEGDIYRRLPGMNDRELERLAGRIAGQLFSAYEELSDAFLLHSPQAELFTDEAQAEIYGHVAGAARAFNITPLNWTKYHKGTLDIRSAFSSIARLLNDEWWISQLKAQRTQWREALLIAAGEVHCNKSGYASKQAIRDVQARRLANMEYLKSCELENVDTGERFSLIDKVMASISNPEIRRMELMSTIAGIEKYAASMKHVGMFLTITTPSKYHPMRKTGKKDSIRVQLNHKWDDAAFSPKDGQRYLVNIWSKMRTAFKDQNLKVYGMRVVEPHHDATPHWHMMLFCEPKHRPSIVAIMKRYALMEDGDERGAQENRFECKHLNRGGAAGYIAKYIAKNIDGYALDGEIDRETGKPLSDTAAAVTAWASTWRIPQFKAIGVPTMGAYRECRSQNLRYISLAESFDERVEAVRAAASDGDFAAYIAAQGGANVPRDLQTVRVARKVADEPNEYDEDVQKIVGIFAPHLGENHIHTTRDTQWRIVAKAVDLEPLTLKSASGAPRSPVNNCGSAGKAATKETADMAPKQDSKRISSPPVDEIAWDDIGNVVLIRELLKEQAPKVNHRLRNYDQLHRPEPAPSARLTQAERQRLPQIHADLTAKGINPQRWELEVLARGAKVSFGDLTFQYQKDDDWGGFTDN